MSTGSHAVDRPGGTGSKGTRLFIGVDIGDEARSIAGRVRLGIEHALRASAVAPRVLWPAADSLHLSLRFLGELDDDAAERVCARLSEPFPFVPFVLQWRGVGVFPGPLEPRVLWMGLTSGAAELGALEAAIAARLDPDTTTAGTPFRPRLVLGRVVVPGAGVDWPGALATIDAATACTVVSRATVYRARQTARGARYTTVQDAPFDVGRVRR